MWQVAIVNGAFEDRFDPNTYANDEPVVITWTDHTWGVPESLFVRMQHLAKAYGLYLLASVDSALACARGTPAADLIVEGP